MALLLKRKYQSSAAYKQEDENSVLVTKLDQILKNQSEMAQAITNFNTRLDTLEQKIEANTNANALELAILKQIVEYKIKLPEIMEFPLKTKEDLLNMEKNIKDDLYEYVNIIKTIITPEGLLENFPKIVDQDIILPYNYDGVLNKNTFKELPNLNMAIFEATKCDGRTLKDYAERIRKCLEVHKARNFRKMSYNKKTSASLTQTTTPICNNNQNHNLQ